MRNALDEDEVDRETSLEPLDCADNVSTPLDARITRRMDDSYSTALGVVLTERERFDVDAGVWQEPRFRHVVSKLGVEYEDAVHGWEHMLDQVPALAIQHLDASLLRIAMLWSARGEPVSLG